MIDMKKKLRIKGNEDSVLSVVLTDIIGLIDKPQQYNWNILWLQAIGELKEGSLLKLEKQINTSKSGHFISFENLMELSKSLTQIIEVLLIGDRKIDNLKRYVNNAEMYSVCDFCIELIDSSYWEITSNDEKSINTIQENLHGIEVLEI